MLYDLPHALEATRRAYPGFPKPYRVRAVEPKLLRADDNSDEPRDVLKSRICAGTIFQLQM